MDLVTSRYEVLRKFRFAVDAVDADSSLITTMSLHCTSNRIGSKKQQQPPGYAIGANL